jgi:predicted ATPase
MYLKSVSLRRDQVSSFDVYPYSIPAIRALDTLQLDAAVTFFVGENGSGKSTLIEAIAVAAGFNAEGGSKNFNFATRRTESELHQHIHLVRGVKRERDGYFARAESLYNVASQIDDLGVSGYGDRSLHAQSHGEAFLALAMNRF